MQRVKTPHIAAFFAFGLAATACATTKSSGMEDAGGSESTGGESDAETSEGDGDSGDGDGDVGDGDGDGDTGDGDGDGFSLPPGAELNTGRVATAHTCEGCHSNAEGAEAMRDEADQPIAPHDLWRGTMMANAARDPLWHAVVEAETLATPAAAELIENKCTRCHAPLLSAEVQLTGAGPVAMDQLYAEGTDSAALGLDGVSCTLCHQIEDQDLGTDASFGGGWTVAGEGKIYGPHAAPFEMPMASHVNMLPVEGHQIQESATCATCHTLTTDALTPEGAATGSSLAEQTPYLEWRNSSYTTENNPGPEAASCQDCHAPTTSAGGLAISTKIARRPNGTDFPPIDDRSPYGRHLFVGGNTLMLGIIRDNAATLNPDAPAVAFDATQAATREQLQQHTASLALGQVGRNGDTLEIPVRVSTSVGHKLPTGFPARRVVLQVELRDASEQVVFRSGEFDDRGRLVDGGGNPLPVELAGGPVMPHFDTISDAGEVQIWESIMADDEGQATYRLLRGASYLKDNRLLPPGWSPMLATPDIAPAGVDGDLDFESAGDTVSYSILAPAAGGPYTLTLTLVYQPLSPRFAAELFSLDGPRINAFEDMLDAADLSPEVVATLSAELDS